MSFIYQHAKVDFRYCLDCDIAFATGTNQDIVHVNCDSLGISQAEYTDLLYQQSTAFTFDDLADDFPHYSTCNHDDYPCCGC